MEEYLDGPEVDVDLVFSQGEPVSEAQAGCGGNRSSVVGPCCVCASSHALLLTASVSCLLSPFPFSLQVFGAVTDNWPTIEPYFNETGSNSPSILPSQQQRELLELAVKSCKSLGLQIVSGGGQGWGGGWAGRARAAEAEAG